jgi:hypothetical protein
VNLLFKWKGPLTKTPKISSATLITWMLTFNNFGCYLEINIEKKIINDLDTKLVLLFSFEI